ncbi:MAG TPA: hypothetical protein VGB14_20400, partial [Acidimicrobiales bacterium]
VAAWPQEKFHDRTPDVWADALRNVDPDDGLAAARLLVRSDNWFPSVARFLETANALARQRTVYRTALVESTEKPLPVEENLRRARELRASLRASPEDRRPSKRSLFRDGDPPVSSPRKLTRHAMSEAVAAARIHRTEDRYG